MRTTAWTVLGLLVVVACRTAPKPEPLSNAAPPVAQLTIALDDTTRDRLALGLPVDLELRLADDPVGRCTLAYDLWNEHYRVSRARTDLAIDVDPARALERCVDTAALPRRRVLALTAHEVPPNRPLPVYPVF